MSSRDSSVDTGEWGLLWALLGSFWAAVTDQAKRIRHSLLQLHLRLITNNSERINGLYPNKSLSKLQFCPSLFFNLEKSLPRTHLDATFSSGIALLEVNTDSRVEISCVPEINIDTQNNGHVCEVHGIYVLIVHYRHLASRG